MKNKLLYLAALVATIYLAILYDFPQMRFLVAFEFLLPLADGILTYFMVRGIQVEVKLPSAGADKMDKIPIYVDVDNHSIFPVSRLGILLEEKCGFTDQIDKLPLEIMVDSRSNTRYLYETEAKYCGEYSFCVCQIRIQGYLKLFSRKRKVYEKSQIDVMPDIYNVDVNIRDNLDGYEREAEKYDPHRPGDDPTEIFQIRGYQPGDSVQRVHWKLSARGDELMVKDYSRPINMYLLLLLDMTVSDSTSCTSERIDSFVEVGVSISRSLILRECSHQVAWIGSDGSLCHIEVQTEKDVYELISMIFRTMPREQEYSMEKLYEASNMGKMPPTVLRLDLQLCLYKNNELEKKFTEGKIEELEGYRLTV